MDKELKKYIKENLEKKKERRSEPFLSRMNREEKNEKSDHLRNL